MPKYILNRTLTVKGFGHAIRFETDVPTYVPPEMVPGVLRVGAKAVDAAHVVAPADEPDMVDAGEEVPAPGEGVVGEMFHNPVTGSDEAVFEAFAILEARNSSDDFGAGNKPHVRALNKLLPFEISGEDRDALWQIHKNKVDE